MPDISLTNFDPRIAELQRQQQLAQLLQQQASEPVVSTGSYRGIQAPISPLSGLAKLLEAYAGGRKSRANAKEQADIQEGQRKEALAALDKMSAPMQSDLTNPSLPQLPQDPNGGLLSALKGRLGMGSAPAPAPPQAAPMPPPQAGPPQVPQGPPPGPPQAPPEGPPGALPPPQTVEQVGAQDRMTPASPQHATTWQERQHMAEQAMISGNPYLEKLAPQLVEQAQRDRMMSAFADQGHSEGGSDDMKAAVQRHIMAGDFKGALALMDKPVEASIKPLVVNNQVIKGDGKGGYSPVFDARTQWRQVPVPDSMKSSVPPGEVVLTNDTGDVKVVKASDAKSMLAQQQESQLVAQRTAPAWANVGISRERLNFDKEQKANAIFDPETINAMAQQAWTGDKSVFQNLGRGVQGAQNIAALRREIYAQGAATGKTPAQLAQMNAQFMGDVSAARAAGTRVGGAMVATSELPGLVAQSSQAYAKLPRTNFKPFNQLEHLVMSGSASPEQAAAYTADFAVVNAYARAISPTGQPHIADQKRAADLLSRASGPQEHEAVLRQIINESNIIKQGATQALHPEAHPAAPAAAPGHVRTYNPATGRLE